MKKIKNFVPILVGLSILVFSIINVSCSVEGANGFPEGMKAVYSVEASDGQAIASAQFYPDRDLGSQRLDEDEVILCNGKELTINNNLSENRYSGNCGLFNVGKTFKFELKRVTDEKTEIYTSTVERPPAFSITYPRDGAQLRRGEDLNITWEAGDGEASLFIKGEVENAAGTKSIPYAHIGKKRIDIGRYIMTSQDTNPKSAGGDISNIAIQVTRTNYGAMDEDLLGSITIQDSSVVRNIKFHK